MKKLKKWKEVMRSKYNILIDVCLDCADCLKYACVECVDCPVGRLKTFLEKEKNNER